MGVRKCVEVCVIAHRHGDYLGYYGEYFRELKIIESTDSIDGEDDAALL